MTRRLLTLISATALLFGCRGDLGYSDSDAASANNTTATSANNSTTGNNGETSSTTSEDAGMAMCNPADCGTNASCVAGACACDSGYNGDPLVECTPGDPCEGVTCPYGSSCGVDGACSCDTGFEPDGNDGCLAVTPGDTASRTAEEVCQRWIADYPMTTNQLFSVEPTAQCDPGTLHPDAIADAVRRTTLFRWLVGLPAVTSNTDHLRLAQACATALSAQDEGLTHELPPSFACYSEDARDGAARSNIVRRTQLPAQSVGIYIGDNGVPSLGHRRWIFNPELGATGFGQRGDYSCMYSIDESGSDTSEYVAYPPPGTIPLAAMIGVWSFHSEDYTFDESSSVEVRAVEANTNLDVSNIYIPDGPFGQRTLAWSVAGTQADTQYEVRIAGLGGPGDSVVYRTTLASCQ